MQLVQARLCFGVCIFFGLEIFRLFSVEASTARQLFHVKKLCTNRISQPMLRHHAWSVLF
jgi:hypothetical protein